jgi:hypothetical protein
MNSRAKFYKRMTIAGALMIGLGFVLLWNLGSFGIDGYWRGFASSQFVITAIGVLDILGLVFLMAGVLFGRRHGDKR